MSKGRHRLGPPSFLMKEVKEGKVVMVPKDIFLMTPLLAHFMVSIRRLVYKVQTTGTVKESDFEQQVLYCLT